MTVDAGTITWLVIGALLLGALAVVIDRVNFPQKPFRPQRIEPGERGASRDRTGAHIVEVSQDDWDEAARQSRRKRPASRSTSRTDPTDGGDAAGTTGEGSPA